MDLFAAKTWENYDPSGLIRLRLDEIGKLIPRDVRTILDAGCGNGVIANSLGKRYQVTALDFSPAALEYVQTEKILASVTAIPLPDKSFDLVMCNEVLEHLSLPDLLQAIAELKRCARGYILVSVPNQEQLESGLIRCASCGEVFHAYGHLQFFNLKRLDALLDLPRLHASTLGPSHKRYWPFLLALRQKYLRQWYKPEVAMNCPRCGSAEFVAQRNLLTKAANFLGRIGARSHPYWLMALYAVPRESNSPNQP